MSFASLSFLYLFLPAALLCYYAAPARWRNGVLLAESLLFYFFGEPVYTLLLLFSSLSDFLHSLYIERHRGQRRAKAALISSIVINLAMLGFFKYADFFIGNWNALTGSHIPLLKVPLPVGISFFTFQTMSYTIDVYRGTVHAERNLATMATYVCLFPQLVAGPIVRYTYRGRGAAQPPLHTGGYGAGPAPLCGGAGQEGSHRQRHGRALRRLARRAGAQHPLRMAVRGGLYAADLLRLLRLQRHGHRPGPDAGLYLPGELQLSLLCPNRDGVLAAVAHDTRLAGSGITSISRWAATG